jgi:hypothetical protein
MSTAEATVNILGVPVGIYTMDTLVARLEELIAAPGCAVAHGVNAHVINLTYHYPEFLKALRQADLLYADGASLILASRFLGNQLPEKLTTTDVWPRMCDLALTRGYRFFLMGGGTQSGGTGRHPGPAKISAPANRRHPSRLFRFSRRAFDRHHQRGAAGCPVGGDGGPPPGPLGHHLETTVTGAVSPDLRRHVQNRRR